MFVGTMETKKIWLAVSDSLLGKRLELGGGPVGGTALRAV